jgi:hypothetical protein
MDDQIEAVAASVATLTATLTSADAETRQAAQAALHDALRAAGVPDLWAAATASTYIAIANGLAQQQDA